MNNKQGKNVLSTGLAIFSMFFGAGNLIFAITLGTKYQNLSPLALAGFMITAVILPILGIISILLFDGDYKKYFGQLGKNAGFILCLFCFIIIGPLVAMPRIVTLAYTVFQPFAPSISLNVFTILFLIITFLLSVSEKNIINLLGKIISPLLIVSLAIIIFSAFLKQGYTEHLEMPITTVLIRNIQYGYNTLDFLTSIFFASIVISILKQSKKGNTINKTSELTGIGLKASMIGVSILALSYAGLAFVGAKFGKNLIHLNEAEIFSAISFRVLGENGALIIAIAVFTACLSTIIALSALCAEYFTLSVFTKYKVQYAYMLILSLAITGIASNIGLSKILLYSKPFIATVSPAILVLAITNMMHKKIGFKYTKIAVFITLAFSIVINLFN